jgi:mono/diheme cytochrome c family protein
MQGWYAPSLTSSREAGVADWDTQHVIGLLRTGVSPRGSVMGPMADVVYRSTQYLAEDDLRAMAVYLKALPQSVESDDEGWLSWFTSGRKKDEPAGAREVRARGADIYERSCADCHGKNGEGAAQAYPPLAANRAVTMKIPTNLIRVVLSGGYLPATAGNPRPYGMPPFAHVLSDADIAAVVTYIRASWGNTAPAVSQLQVMRLRAGEHE